MAVDMKRKFTFNLPHVNSCETKQTTRWTKQTTFSPKFTQPRSQDLYPGKEWDQGNDRGVIVGHSEQGQVLSILHVLGELRR